MNRPPYLGIVVALVAAGLLAYATHNDRWLSATVGNTRLEVGLDSMRTCETDEAQIEVCKPVDFQSMPAAYGILRPAIYWGGLAAAGLLLAAAALAFAGVLMGRLLTPPRLALLASMLVLGAIAALTFVAGHTPSGHDRGLICGLGGGVLGALGAAAISHWHKFGAMTGVTGGRAEIARWDQGMGKVGARAGADVGARVAPAPAQPGMGRRDVCPTCGTRTHLEEGRSYCELCQKFV